MIKKLTSAIRSKMPFIIPIILLPNIFKEFYKYIKYSGVISYKNSQRKSIGKIIMGYHVIEKGLSMPNTKLGFGTTKVTELINECTSYINKFGKDDIQLIHAIEVINEYKKYHKDNNYSINSKLSDEIEKLKKISKIESCTKQINVNKEDYFSKIRSDFSTFSKSRKSIRNYSNDEIPIELIESAVDIAKFAPSSCNRQSYRVHLINNKNSIFEILKIQGGNRGFGNLANKLIIVTANLNYYHAVFEKNGVYVDGGLFSMNLLYALHEKGIGACSLNCCFSSKKESKIRQLIGLNNSEVMIMMITCGFVPENFKYALSEKYSVSEFLIQHN